MAFNFLMAEIIGFDLTTTAVFLQERCFEKLYLTFREGANAYP